jgi:uncharacterized protein
MQATAAGQQPFLCYGLGLRPSHYQDILDQRPPVDWLEALTDQRVAAKVA